MKDQPLSQSPWIFRGVSDDMAKVGGRGTRISSMAANVVVDVERTDLQRAARCSEMSCPSVERHGGRVLGGGWPRQPLVLIEFEAAEAAQAWCDSEDYRAACAVRCGASKWRMVVVDGV